MPTELTITNKKLNTSILIKKNYIYRFILNLAEKNEKVFCVIDSKIKSKFNFKRYKKVDPISFEVNHNNPLIQTVPIFIKK